MEKLLRKASRIAMAVFMFCSLFLFNVAQINAHEGEKDRNSSDGYHFIYSDNSSNATLYYSLDGGKLVQLEKGATKIVSKDYEEKKISFYVKVLEGYSAGSEFKHKSKNLESSLNLPGWDDGTYKKIESAPTGQSFDKPNQEAKGLGCSYQFHYTIDDYKYRKFEITANPVTLSLKYDLKDGESNPAIVDNNKYTHSNVSEGGYKNEFTIPTTVPTKANNKFLGWKLTNVDKVKDKLFQPGEKVKVDGIWETPDVSEFTYNFEAQWAQTYSVMYYESEKKPYPQLNTHKYATGATVELYDGSELSANQGHIWIGWSKEHNISGNNSNMISSHKQYEEAMQSGKLLKKGASIIVESQDIKLYAVWAKKGVVDEEKYTITTTTDEGGNISKGQSEIYYGNSSKPITYSAKPGYAISRVEVTNNDTKEMIVLELERFPESYTIESVTANYTVNLITTVDDTGVEVDGYKGKYDGKEHTPIIVGTVAKDIVEYSEDGKSYNTDPIGYTNAGTNSVHVKISRGSNIIYEGKVKIIISQRVIAVITARDEKIYDGTPLTNANYELLEGELNGVLIDGFVDGEGFDLENTEAIGTITNPGSTVNEFKYDFDEHTSSANYTIKLVENFLTITTNTTDLTANAADVEKVYDGEAYGISVNASLKDATIKYADKEGKFTLTETPTFTDVETYTVKYKVSKTGYASVEGSAEVVIEKAEVTITVADATKQFGTKDPDFTAKLEGVVGEDKVSYTLTREVGEDLGKYVITATAEEHKNYTFEVVKGTLTITTNTTDLTASAANVEKVYDGEAYGISVNASLKDATIKYADKDGKFTLTETPTYTDAGTYTVKYQVSKTGYKTVEQSAKVVIEKAEVTITVADATKQFGTEDPEFTAKVEGEVGEDKVSYEFEREEGEAVRGYAITATPEEHNNYTVEVIPGTLTIVTNTTDLTASADDVAEVYNGDEYSVKVNASLGDATIAYADEDGNYTLTEAPVFTDAGTYTVKYQVSKEGYAPVEGSATVVITQAEVTISANDATKVVGSEDPDLTAVLGELFNDDTIEYTVVREAGETVGTYTINVEVQEHKNYKVLVEAGVFTITAAPVTPTPIPPVTPTPIPPVGPDTPTPIVTPTPPVVTPPVVTPPVVTPDAPIVTPDAPVVEEVVDPETPKAEGNEKVESNKTPKSSGNENSWALVNLISAAGTLLLGMILLLSKTNKEEEEEENVNAYKRSKLMKVISSLVAIFTVVLFFLTENMRLAMTFIDKWTIVMVVLLVVQVVIYFMARRWKEIDTDEDTVEAK